MNEVNRKNQIEYESAAIRTAMCVYRSNNFEEWSDLYYKLGVLREEYNLLLF